MNDEMPGSSSTIKILISLPLTHLHGRHDISREHDRRGKPTKGRVSELDVPTVGLRHGTDDGQSEAGSLADL